MKNGKFIVIEGGDGAGKSCQCRLLAERLVNDGADAIVTREPGGAPLAEALRTLILDPAYSPDAVAELYMYSAARRDHMNTVIIPALEAGKTVVCDRFIYSTVAYQGYGRGLDIDFVREVNRKTIAPLTVDLALFVDVPPAVAFARKGGADKSDRLESERSDFYERIYQGFDSMCESGELLRIDASGKKEETADKIYAAVKRIL